MLGLRNSSQYQASKSPLTSVANIEPDHDPVPKISLDTHTPSSPPAAKMEFEEALDQLSVLKKGAIPAIDQKPVMRVTSTTSETGSSWSEARTQFTSEQQVTVLKETVVYTRGRLISEIRHVDEHYIDSLNIDRFLEYIERERLTNMPQRGSKWDWVLKWAEFFALQISGYAKVVGPFVPASKDAAKLIYASCRALLELGAENAAALETTFSIFYKLGLSVSVFLRHNSLLHVTSHIRAEVGQAFNDLLKLVRDVSIYYQVKTWTTKSSDVSISFSDLFGSTIDTFYERKDHIVNAMWQYRLGGHGTDDIYTLRKWLSPRDPLVHNIINHERGVVATREEFTCEWFQRPLLDFTRGKDDCFEVIGASGSGKSVLFGWVLERLQRPLGKKSHQTLSFRFESDIPSQTTGLAAVKSLALQLLENNIGDTDLYKALMAVYEKAEDSKNGRALEESLWHALETGLKSDAAKSEHYMIVLDGVNKMKKGAHGASHLQGHLTTITSKCSNLQAITLSTEPNSSNKSKVRTLKITPDLTHEDLRRITDKALSGYAHFEARNEFEEESIVDQLLHAAKGDFTWALLTADHLRKESSQSDFKKAVAKAKESPKTVSDMIQTVFNSLDFTKRDTRLLLAWLTVAERPLTVTEVKCLLQIGLNKKLLHDRQSDIHKDIQAACGSLVVVKDDFVRFRFPAVRVQLLKLQAEGKKIMSQRDAQTNLTLRLVAYCKFMLNSKVGLLVDFTNADIHRELFHKHVFLDYAVRYWTSHFRFSSLRGEEDSKSFQLSADFKALFPSSVQFAILEWLCWDSQRWTSEYIDAHILALHVRQAVFTEKHESVLQTIFICGNLYKKLSNVTEAGDFFYRACTLGQSVLSQYHTFISTCGTMFLTLAATIRSTTRTEVITRKEQTLKYLILAFKHQHGQTSDIVIRYYKILAELYMEIHEEEHAETIWRELREIIIIRHGKGSEEERDISGHITVILKKHGKQEDIIEYEKSIFEIANVMEIWDERRIKIMLELAISYETRGEYFMAEELYVTIWRRLIERCGDHHHHSGVELHILTIDVVLEYVRFLRRRHRHEEACSVLICIWTSYEAYDFESEILFLRLKMIGELMRAVGLLTICISVFRKCLAWFSFRGHHEHTKTCELLISEVSVEIVKTTTTRTTTTTVTTTTSETVIRESFELSLTQSITVEAISVFRSMISYYMKLEQWYEAIECTKKSLSVLWKLVLSGHGTIFALPDRFSAEAIEIAISLAICHLKAHRFYEAEEIYLRIYRACRNSCHIHDERMVRACKVLIAFYEEHHSWQKMIEIYQELLIDYRKHLGASHKKTIEVLYILGHLCSEHGHGRSLDYYEEIILVLNGDSKVCHHDAFKAMRIICRMYYEGAHWGKLRIVCENLWYLFNHHHHEYTFEAEFVELLYARYRYVLEYHVHCEYEFLRSITIIYRDICTKIFGAAVEITIKALIEFGHLCMRSEKYIYEAVHTYEKVLTITTTTTTTTTTKTIISTEQMVKIKQTLVQAYATICSHESVSTETIERAIIIVHEHFERVRVQFGCAHIEVLHTCRKLVLLYLKLRTQEAHGHIKRILVETVVEILIKEKTSGSLNEAARLLGEIFLVCDLADYGLAMLKEMRRQIITGTCSAKSGFNLKLLKSVGKVSYVFLVTLQETLERTVVSRYSVLLSEILTETFLYEHYSYCLKSSKKIEEILIHTARLRAFLISRSRGDQVHDFEDHVYELFMDKWVNTLKVRREITRVFYICLLEELAVEGVTLGYAACVSSTNKIKKLLEQGKFNEALEVGTCAFQFLNHLRFYHDIAHIGHGFKLSALMALRGVKVSDKGIDAEVRKNLLALSRTIIGDVFKACKESKINFVRLQLGELNDLVGLLGDQENYVDLEWLLTMLWSSREVQKNWSSQTIVAIGRRLVEVKFLQNHKPEAIRLCEDIGYNLRSLYSALHPHTLEMSDLLCQLYTSAGHYREAMGVHESILRLVIEGDDDDDSTIDTVSSEVAKKHVDLLKQSYLRLGGWDKSSATYKELVDAVLDLDEYKGRAEWQRVQSPNKWNVKETPDDSDKFKAPLHWEFDHVHDEVEREDRPKSPSKKRPGLAAKRASSNWGMGLIHRFLHGEHDSDNEEEEEPHPTKSNGLGPAEDPLPAKPFTAWVY